MFWWEKAQLTESIVRRFFVVVVDLFVSIASSNTTDSKTLNHCLTLFDCIVFVAVGVFFLVLLLFDCCCCFRLSLRMSLRVMYLSHHIVVAFVAVVWLDVAAGVGIHDTMFLAFSLLEL